MAPEERSDPFDLERFVAAQQGVYAVALGELQAGRKRTHWMWFIFPQLAGLGSSVMAEAYAVRGLQEARAYLQHPVLGARLTACTEAVLALSGHSISDMFDDPDDLKFHASMTLFACAAGRGSVFERALAQCFDAQRHARTLDLLQALERANSPEVS